MGFFYAEKKKEETRATKKSSGSSAPREKKEKQIKIKPCNSYPEEEKKVFAIYKPDQATRILKKFLKEGLPFAFDYETSGKKPYAKGHFIRCISICNNIDIAFVFEIFDDEDFRIALKDLLTSDVKKIAHNIKFEALWTRIIFGYDLQEIYYDTMIAAHCLDNNRGASGLKYQVKSRYNIFDYEGTVDQYIHSTDKCANSFNRISECPLDQLLLYCGFDSLFTFRLYNDQQEEMSAFIRKGFDLFMEGTEAFIDVEQNGISVDMDFYEYQNQKLIKKMDRLVDKINSTDEAKQWQGKDEFKFTSILHLKELLFDTLKYEPPKLTDKGNISIDQEALEQIDSPMIKLILEYRRYKQIQNTFLSGFMREEINGKIYPSFNLNTVVTFRSSSSNPNFQNIPKRDEEAQGIIRGGLTPSKGNQILEVDYSGVEVRISACYHKDPAMLKYILDPETDMHRDMAKELFLLEDVPKHLRQGAKNGFVFPQFYGDYYINCAKNLWGWLEPEDIIHLKEKGIKSLKAFEKHVKKVENIFWNEKFQNYTKWKNKTWERYQDKQFVNIITGFKCQGYMRKNEVLNYPIQGAAFHCLLWSLVKVNKFIKENNLKSKIIGQVHDSMVIDLRPDEKEILIPEIQKITCVDLPEAWDWIIVPLEVEMEISKVDGSWAEMEKIK